MGTASVKSALMVPARWWRMWVCSLPFLARGRETAAFRVPVELLFSGREMGCGAWYYRRREGLTDNWPMGTFPRFCVRRASSMNTAQLK